MAQKRITTLTDDLTGRELAAGSGETVHFAIDGTSYELDVGTKSAERFRSILAPYVAAGRRLTGSRRLPVRRVRTTPDPSAVRAWAASNGIRVGDRGRVPAAVIAQFEAAGN